MNGPNTHPVYTFLKDPRWTANGKPAFVDPLPGLGDLRYIKWNYEKYSAFVSLCGATAR